MRTKFWFALLCSTSVVNALDSAGLLVPDAATNKQVASSAVSASDVNQENVSSKSSMLQINANNLSNIDNNADDLIQLKRKLELEKAQAEIKKIRGGGTPSSSNNSGIVQDNIQTIVTGVAINQDGKKIAWLQFADGGSLIVNIGSQVGRYTVSDITMTGVRLSTHNSRDKAGNIFLKRAYYAPEKAKNQANSNKTFFSPSPIITGANTTDDNDMVPPIMPLR